MSHETKPPILDHKGSGNLKKKRKKTSKNTHTGKKVHMDARRANCSMMEFRAVISKPSFPPTLPKKTLLSR